MSRTLFELSDEILNIEQVLENLDDDNEDMTAVIDEYLAGLRGDLNAKLDNYATFIRELEARSTARKEEADRLSQHAKVDMDKVARLKDCLRWYFMTHNLKTIETPRYRLTLAANGGKPPLLLTVPVEELPQEYVVETISYKPDMEAIRADLASGKIIPGAELAERGCNIRIS